ncbi:potassium voltage-gated channel subfamily E member 3, partial [Zootoca vivipara]|uniref:potassium voltage-gated channel subfamily E member 3 n=1 Tax=Zootoca vivipara TaxID=8524 RepID=UPI00293BCE79
REGVTARAGFASRLAQGGCCCRETLRCRIPQASEPAPLDSSSSSSRWRYTKSRGFYRHKSLYLPSRQAKGTVADQERFPVEPWFSSGLVDEQIGSRTPKTQNSNGTPWDRTMASALGNLTETWLQKLDSMMEALNQTLSHVCPQDAKPVEEEEDNSYSYVYILFVMILFAVTVGGLILGYTRSRKEVDKQSDPYHVYIKNRVSMI